MKPPIPKVDEFVEKRQKAYSIGQLRREKMVLMKVGERRMPGKNQPDSKKSTG